MLEIVGLVAVVDFVNARWRVIARGTSVVLVGGMLALAAAPLVTEHDPIWASDGNFTNAAIVANGGNHTAPIWLEGVRLLSCAKPGELVAYSEMGYAPFARLDLRFLDLRGLTDKQISRSAPAAMHDAFGVDPFLPASQGANLWTLPTSPVGRVIVSDQPALILTFDFPSGGSVPNVIDGDYVKVTEDAFPGKPPLVLYRRPGVTCAVHV
jgi:hypothetical protein